MTQFRDHPIEAHEVQRAPDPARPPYDSPLLRCHGSVREVTQKSGEQDGTIVSDVTSKENIVSISWG
jgi:hypothetical protein